VEDDGDGEGDGEAFDCDELTEEDENEVGAEDDQNEELPGCPVLFEARGLEPDASGWVSFML
jgi:hypothetical protein